MLVANGREPLQTNSVLTVGLSAGLTLLIAGTCVQAQSAEPVLKFDVASVRANHTADCRGRWDFAASHGTVTADNAPLLRIISRAYNLTDDRVSGPAWIESECYDITAKSPSDVPVGDLMTMLQELLKERFHLVAHRESTERPILALLPDKGGVRMPSEGDTVPVPSTDDGKILFMAKTLQDLCERLGKVAGRPVVNKTGLDGRYVIVLSYLPFDAKSPGSGGASDIFSAVRDQLGLRLESQRGAVEILKVESIDKVPTEN